MVLIGEILAVLAAVVLFSYLVEGLRRPPSAPTRLAWLPTAPIDTVDADGTRLRYIDVGEGPTLVLLHTLRTQLDMFQKIVPVLAARFRVLALDLPGHGWSDIPDASYDADYFVHRVGKALDRLQVKDAVIVGESIGGSIALLLAARHHPAVRGVVAINPYDYAAGRGIRRSSLLANLFFGLLNVPIVGPTINRLRSLPVVTGILRGGVRRKGALPPDLAREIHLVGSRPGQAGAIAALVRHWGSWEARRVEYSAIDRPVLLLYGDQDWSRDGERAADARAIPGAELRVIANAGHFLALDAPDDVLAHLVPWLAGLEGSESGTAQRKGGGVGVRHRRLRLCGFEALTAPRSSCRRSAGTSRSPYRRRSRPG
jgi:pimeloyl-ACP methyl ester carboxylesterase